MQPEPAFVLHTRPYRETSLLVDFFTRNYGRFRAVARADCPRVKASALIESDHKG